MNKLTKKQGDKSQRKPGPEEERLIIPGDPEEALDKLFRKPTPKKKRKKSGK